MCTQVRIRNHLCSTPRQLADCLGGEDSLQWLECRQQMDWCLCVIDVPATLDRYGVKYTQDGLTTLFVAE